VRAPNCRAVARRFAAGESLEQIATSIWGCGIYFGLPGMRRCPVLRCAHFVAIEEALRRHIRRQDEKRKARRRK